jgi:alkaline phosphatase D
MKIILDQKKVSEKITFCLIMFFISVLKIQAQQIVSGPMISYCENREVGIWLEIDSNTNLLELKYWSNGNNMKSIAKTVLPIDKRTIHIVLGELDMGTKYNYEVYLNGNKISTNVPTTFTTETYWEHRTKSPSFSFLFGSCLYLNDSLYDRPTAAYGQDTAILDAMAQTSATFNLWGGDNVYLREADFSSVSGIKYRYNKNFRNKNLQKVRAARPNYAIWDDHDYGPNNSDYTFDLSSTTKEMFLDYFPQKTLPEKGIYQKFSWYNCDFFLTDSRTFRSPNNLKNSDSTKAFFGDVQLQWLQHSLLSSDAMLKFVVVGSQVLNPLNDKEALNQFSKEYNKLLNFIIEYKINGVVFLSGDRHFTELQMYKPKNFYTLYDFTCSPITSGIHKINDIELNSKTRVNNSLITKNNFSKIAINYDKNTDKYSLQFLVYDKNLKELFNHIVPIEELKVK